MVEFTLVMLPLLSMIFVLLDIGWAIFVKCTMQNAVRDAVRYGITEPTPPSGSCLTDVVKSSVQQYSMGLLTGTTGLSYIKVNYFLPPAAGANSPPTDVSTALNADAGGNIMQVSVQGYNLAPFVPRVFNWTQAADKSPLIVNVYAADVIEPTRTPPCVGTAP
jgi:Flp pilus assembly protein TadG